MPKSLWAIVLLFPFLSFAQKPFEGKITYSISYLEFPEGKEGMAHVLPSRATWFISGAETRVESRTEVGGETTTIYSKGEDSLTVLFELTDQSVFYRREIDEPIKFRVAPQQKTKEVNGVLLTKHIMQSAEGIVLEAWCDTKFQNTSATGLKDLKFLPLIFDKVEHGVKMRYSFESIKSYPIDETYFLIPPNRVRVSSSTLQKIVR